MDKTKSPSSLPKTAQVVIQGIQEVKGKEIVFIDLRKITSRTCDYFVVCHGESTTQVKAIAESVEKETFETLNTKPWHVEGKQNSEWILLDYGDLMVHVFHQEARQHYNIESLWGDAIIEPIQCERN